MKTNFMIHKTVAALGFFIFLLTCSTQVLSQAADDWRMKGDSLIHASLSENWHYSKADYDFVQKFWAEEDTVYKRNLIEKAKMGDEGALATLAFFQTPYSKKFELDLKEEEIKMVIIFYYQTIFFLNMDKEVNAIFEESEGESNENNSKDSETKKALHRYEKKQIDRSEITEEPPIEVE